MPNHRFRGTDHSAANPTSTKNALNARLPDELPDIVAEVHVQSAEHRIHLFARAGRRARVRAGELPVHAGPACQAKQHACSGNRREHLRAAHPVRHRIAECCARADRRGDQEQGEKRGERPITSSRGGRVTAMCVPHRLNGTGRCRRAPPSLRSKHPHRVDSRRALRGKKRREQRRCAK
jgi:hypothetical protein